MLALAGCRQGDVVDLLPEGADRDVVRDARACEAGDAQACNNVAESLESGRDATPDPTAALALYRRACDGEAWLACVNAARMLSAEASTASYDEARALSARACDAGFPVACASLGRLWAGDDAAAAAAAFRQACDGLVFDACAELGLRHQRGTGVDVDPERALSLLVRACGGGSMRGCALQADVLVETDPPLALVLYRQACIGGYAAGCVTVAEWVESGKAADDIGSAAAYRRQACALGLDEECSR